MAVADAAASSWLAAQRSRLAWLGRSWPEPQALRLVTGLTPSPLTPARQRMVHEERLQQETQERMLREEDRREHADKLVTHMEEQEEVAIERLRRAQDAQKAAYEELERALTNPPPPIEQREVALGGGGMH